MVATTPLRVVEGREDAEASRPALRLQAIVDRLQREADKRVGQRLSIEKRWIEDLEQYHGKYDASTLGRLSSRKRSQLFINLTRAKTNSMEARLSDMLFPVDDKNYSINPTPVPELSAGAQEAVQAALAAAEQAKAQPQNPQAQQQADATARLAAQLKATLDEAHKRAKAMEAEVDDQLRECAYNIQAREVIRDGCLLGTGVMKGPVVGDRPAMGWRQGGSNGYELYQRRETQPAFHRVDPWSFFPDMDARTLGEGEGVFERHLFTKQDLRKLAKRDGFDVGAIRRLLTTEARSATPTYLADLRSITGVHIDSSAERYQAWEYHGPLDAEDIRHLMMAMAGDEIPEIAEEEIDPLKELCGIVWFCQGELLRFAVYPLDSNEALYSAWNLEKDDSSPFGYGVPCIMRHPQKSLNAAWRMMMDNSGLSAGPQIVIDTASLEPENGSWELTPNKVWTRKQGATNQEPFRVYNIDSHQAELAAIIDLSKQFIDDETAQPQIAQGEQGQTPTPTATGITLLMNSANVVFRRHVKNWDDDMTTPNIRRLYHWNMQFSSKEHIKGDYEVDARGTSVLLLRDVQASNLMLLVSQFSAHPVLGGITKVAAAYRRLVQSLMLPADEIVMTDDEIAEQQQNQQPQPDPDVVKAQTQMEIARLEADSRLQVASLQRETAMISLAAQQNMKLNELTAMLDDRDKERRSKERIFAAEAAVQQQNPQRPGGGGYV